MSRAKRGDRLAFLVVAAGLAIGHGISYWIAIPDPIQRAVILQRTGHAYLHVFADAALILATAAIVTSALRALREGPDGRSETFRLAWRVGAVQVAGFLAMEVGERVASHATFMDLLNDRILATGVVVQLLVATLSVLLLRWIAATTVRLASVLGSAGGRAPVGSSRPLPTLVVALRSIPAIANGARAPPVPSFSLS
jgi:hypothetical protein